MTFLYVQAFNFFSLCPFLSSLRLLPLQFPFVSKRSGNFLLFVNARMWRLSWEGEKGPVILACMVCYATYMKPNLIKLIAFFLFIYFSTACDQGSTFSSACVGFTFEKWKLSKFSFSRGFFEMIWGKSYFDFFLSSLFSYEILEKVFWWNLRVKSLRWKKFLLVNWRWLKF
jgi:hypothetical protein